VKATVQPPPQDRRTRDRDEEEDVEDEDDDEDEDGYDESYIKLSQVAPAPVNNVPLTDEDVSSDKVESALRWRTQKNNTPEPTAEVTIDPELIRKHKEKQKAWLESEAKKLAENHTKIRQEMERSSVTALKLLFLLWLFIFCCIFYHVFATIRVGKNPATTSFSSVVSSSFSSVVSSSFSSILASLSSFWRSTFSV